MEGTEAGARLAEVTIPTLIVHGRDDRMVGFESALRFLSLIGGSLTASWLV